MLEVEVIALLLLRDVLYHSVRASRVVLRGDGTVVQDPRQPASQQAGPHAVRPCLSWLRSLSHTTIWFQLGIEWASTSVQITPSNLPVGKVQKEGYEGS